MTPWVKNSSASTCAWPHGALLPRLSDKVLIAVGPTARGGALLAWLSYKVRAILCTAGVAEM